MREFLERLKRLVFGAPVATDLTRPQAMRSRLALPVFGAGVVSAVAYGPDAVVAALRSGAQQDAIPSMAGGVVVILVLIGAAYASQVRAFPHERGDYGVVRDRLGERLGMITGASLLIDYLFTVAIAVSAIAEIVIFLIPSWTGAEAGIAVAALAFMTLANLRGVRDRRRVLLTVWYGFLVVLGVLAAVGIARHGTQRLDPAAVADAPETWTVLAAYAGAIASGAVMATGLEHLVSSGPYHAEPRGKRASRTLLTAVLAAAVAFFVISWLAWSNRLTGWSSGSILMQVSEQVFGNAIGVWAVGIATVAILYAAATSVFRRFSRLTGLLASDGVLPRQMAMRNDRLVLRGAILLVAALSATIVIAVQANVSHLVHMFIVGVFTAVVLSQRAMIEWTTAKLKLVKEPNEQWRLEARRLLHIVALVVAVGVLAVTAVFNFANGAWIAIVLIVLVVVMMHSIKRHYAAVRADIAIDREAKAPSLPSATHGIVLVAQMHRPALHALAYAKAARHSTLKAVTVQIDRGAAVALQRRWATMNLGAPLVVLDSPYRDLVGPMLEYVKRMHRASPREAVFVYVPEYIVGRWWEQLLHNRSTARLRAQLLNVPNVVVSAVPWMLESARREGPVDDVVIDGPEPQ
ncbi:MAG: amino acid permease [Demequina sp.]|uniref:APC family permease n=1 Tax=Demequina sp. TaxID=2050685 RepID=UPI001984EF80|nr:APC family permease [Demequina sp.]MBC7299132.1 amino acid permease [Demequina sp.]